MNKCFYLYYFCPVTIEFIGFWENTTAGLFVLCMKKDKTGNGNMKKFKYFCNKDFYGKSNS